MNRPELGTVAAFVAFGLGLAAIAHAVAHQTDHAARAVTAGAAALALAAVLTGRMRWPDGGNGGEVVDLAAWKAAA